MEEFRGGRVGEAIDVKAGDEVKLAHDTEAIHVTGRGAMTSKDPVELWNKCTQSESKAKLLPSSDGDFILRAEFNLLGVIASPV